MNTVEEPRFETKLLSFKPMIFIGFSVDIIRLNEDYFNEN